MADIILGATPGVHRPRNVDWKRAAALLYGDWGTSKAYVIGLAFVAAAFSSLPIILAVFLSVPTVLVVIVLIGLSAPHLTTHHLERPHESFARLWVQFVGVILALSGVEAIANLTGVMKLDHGSTMDQPRVGREASKAIWPVAVEVVLGTALLGWAMLSMNPTRIVQV